jgi:hypothetical protein
VSERIEVRTIEEDLRNLLADLPRLHGKTWPEIGPEDRAGLIEHHEFCVREGIPSTPPWIEEGDGT